VSFDQRKRGISMHSAADLAELSDRELRDLALATETIRGFVGDLQSRAGG